MKVFRLFIILLIIALCMNVGSYAAPKRPKLVVGLVIDQMRWDYLYRFYDQYGDGGFRRLLKDGFKCQNTMISYLPAFTAPGHTCIYTGSVPAIHGIAGNDWVDSRTGRSWYCTDDTSVYLAEDAKKGPSMSPRNLLVTTVTDELRLATNMKSRVYGVALKDRASILPAGHLANAAYWYNEKTGNFGTSSYYSNQNPTWLQQFNKRNAGDSMLKKGWKLLYDKDAYDQSTEDASKYEKGYGSEQSPVFPHQFAAMSREDRNRLIKATPAGNTFTAMMAKACLEGEQLGMGDETDFLTLSMSSTDYVGHQFGPNSVEAEDCFLRLDRDIADLLAYLDDKYGRDNYLMFLTADHGGAHNAAFLEDRHVPAGSLDKNLMKDMRGYLKTKFGDSLVLSLDNYQVTFSDKAIAARKLDKGKVKQAVIAWLNLRPEVAYTIDLEDINKTPLPEPMHSMAINGYHRTRSGSVQFILNPGWYDNGGRLTGTTHGSWNPYDTHIPLIWYGWHVPAGETSEEVHMTDIAPTISSMLHIQMPNGCVGKPVLKITE